MKLEILKEGFGFEVGSVVEATESNAGKMIERGIAKKAADNAKLNAKHEKFDIKSARLKKGLDKLEEVEKKK